MSKIGYIYKIVDNTNDNQYYGSTTQTVAQRVSAHRSRFKNNTLTCLSVEILKNGNWRYETLEKVLFDEKFQLVKVLREHIEKNECINKITMTRTPDEKKQRMHQYRIDNAEQIKQQGKQYYIDNADKIKQYQQDNKTKMNLYSKQYYIDNHEKLHTKQKCECGGKFMTKNKTAHEKTYMHQNYIKKIQRNTILNIHTK